MVEDKPRTPRFAYAIAGGLLFGLATPPSDVLLGVPVGLFLLALAVRQSTRVSQGILLGSLWASSAGLVGMRFVPIVITLFTDLGPAAAVAAHALLSVAQSLWWGLGMGVAVWLRQRWRSSFAFAFAFSVLVTLCMPNVFVWSPAGLLSPWPMLIQSADLVGERGVSALLALYVGLAAQLDREWRRRFRASWSGRLNALGRALRLPLLLALLPVPLILYGTWSMERFDDEGPRMRIGLIQAAISPKHRWKPKNWASILKSLREQTQKAEEKKVELSIWPEAAYPYPLKHDATRAPRDSRRRVLDKTIQGPVLFGFISMAKAVREADGRYRRDRYNSATIISPDGTLQPSYDKIELLWFGETVPAGSYLPWLRRMFQRSGGLIPGNELRALRTANASGTDVRLGVLNCYEDTLPNLGRRIARELSPDLLVNVTNDAWFVGTAEPELHLRLSVMRAIELRRDLVRSVNLGVPAWIDASGRIRAQQLTGQFPAAPPPPLIVEPRLRRGPPTLYARFGDLPMLLLLAAGLWASAFRSSKQRNPNGQPDSTQPPSTS